MKEKKRIIQNHHDNNSHRSHEEHGRKKREIAPTEKNSININENIKPESTEIDMAHNEIHFTPDSRGEGYQPLEFGIASDVLKKLYWKQDDHSFTAQRGSAWDAKKTMLAYGLAASDIHDLSQLPVDWYKNDAYAHLLFNKGAVAYVNTPNIAAAAANYFYKLRMEFGGEHPDNTWNVPGLENKRLKDYTDQDKIKAMNYFADQPLPKEENEPSNLTLYLNAINSLLIIDQALSLGKSLLTKGLLEGVSENEIESSLKGKIEITPKPEGTQLKLVNKLPESLKGAELGGVPEIVREIGDLNHQSPYLFFMDTYKGQPRLNVVGHGILSPEGFVKVVRSPTGPKTPFDVSLDVYEISENYPFENIRCIGCHTAEGGINSFAQNLANYTGKPVKGFHGRVSMTGRLNEEEPILIKHEFDNMLYKGAGATWHYEPQKFFRIWRPWQD